jgi:hypothetical protein
MRVRFVDPQTNRIVSPEPLSETPSNNATPRIGTNTPSVGALPINPLLAPATLPWDIRLPLESYLECCTQAQRAKLAESATQPPATRLELQSPQLPWRIEIRPRTPSLFVTVYDVLLTIQADLKLQITPEEWEQFEDAGKRLIVAARGARAQGCDPSKQVDELYNRPRRIDSLREFTRFAGLVPAPQRTSNSFDLKLHQQNGRIAVRLCDRCGDRTAPIATDISP